MISLRLLGGGRRIVVEGLLLVHEIGALDRCSRLAWYHDVRFIVCVLACKRISLDTDIEASHN